MHLCAGRFVAFPKLEVNGPATTVGDVTQSEDLKVLPTSIEFLNIGPGDHERRAIAAVRYQWHEKVVAAAVWQ